MIHSINKGDRRPEYGTFGLWIGKKSISKLVIFNDTSECLPKGYHNLFGIGYFGGDTVNYQWRYEPKFDKITIAASVNSITADIISVSLHEEINLTIDIINDGYIFTVRLHGEVITRKVSAINKSIFSYPTSLQLSSEAECPVKVYIDNY